MTANTNTAKPIEPWGRGREALEVLYQFVAAIELTPNVAVHSADRDGIVRYWNNTCQELYGLSALEAVGKPLVSLFSHLSDQAEFEEVLATAWRSGQPSAPHDWHVQRLDGIQRWVYSSHFPVNRDGVPQQLLCMEVDITDRKIDEAALVRAGGNFRHLFERSTDAILLIDGARIIDANPAALALFRCGDKQAMLGKSLPDFSPPFQPSGADSQTENAVMAEQTFRLGNLRYEWTYRNCDGAAFWAEVLLTSIAVGDSRLSYAVIRDISARKAAERTVYMAAQVFENCRDAILITDKQHRVVAANPAFTEIAGYSVDEAIGAEVPNLHSDTHEPAFYAEIWEYVDQQGHWEGEIWSVRKNGETYPVWVALTAIRDAAHEVSNYMAILSDITDRKQVEDHHRHLAEHDFLTDLPNRVLFLDRVHQALAVARRGHSRVALMFIDLDRFKSINDTYGHQAGDIVLKEVGVRLTRCVRGVDTVSRQGGDEFVVLLADVGGVDQAAHIAISVMQALAEPISLGLHEVSPSVSIGICTYPGDGEDPDTLLAHADVAMYHAKQRGRNAFQFFSPEMNARVIERIEIENTLRVALENEEFELEYLPEIDMASGRTIGVEALIRWRHPERGLLQPDQFLDIAEETGLIVPIGEWVLRHACVRARRWRDQGFEVVVAVNLSGVQFMHSNLIQSIDSALHGSGLAPQYLDLEVTERVIMNGDPSTAATIDALRRRGVQLTIDDFGTGSSSLSSLRKVPLSRLKIDRSFVGDILADPPDAAIIPAIIAVARSLRLRVAAEGVETAEQLDYLREQGCDEYQGFYASMASSDPDLTSRHP